ncbi:MAG: hypothetical protein A3G34_17310 [Candidatus Lindowbacteria bacterium RIFCSPLOWO2_12_FULL_62_27]|nr:MAG: hypothetical protein A3G34_17310 [Candidatus Lindowbacteria bacterium RIFCSPLOWO2_12_FULL_62_27]OGH62190.1 MAG: hypothetical protein A3I06_01430 [Candidatus Lindowbacteria bacterium RIFCSPLOWO2_02_FULL_62_12]
MSDTRLERRFGHVYGKTAPCIETLKHHRRFLDSSGGISDTSGMKTKSKNAARGRRAMALIRKIQAMSDKYGGPTKGKTEEEILRAMKKTREELWDKYLASRP